MPDECGLFVVTRTQDDQAPRPAFAACFLTDAGPGLPAAEHSAEHAAQNPQSVRAFHRDRGIVGLAAVRIVNATGPFCVRRLHVDENFLAVRQRIPAKVLPALLDADHPLAFFRVPYAERRGRRLNRRGGGGGLFRRGGRSHGRQIFSVCWWWGRPM